MQIFHDFESVPAAFYNGAVSIGKFDGVHCGHALIFRHLKSHADKLSAPSIVVTFWPHPIAILRADSQNIRPIQTLSRKIELIKNFNVDAIIIIEPDKKFLLQSAETFFFNTIIGQLRSQIIVCGKNFTFGHARTGTVESMIHYGKSTKTNIDIVNSVQINGMTISSSFIRKLLQEGKVSEADKFLGLPYRMSGIVVKGDARGRLLGFPTANIERIETIIPQHGVYATIATVEGKQFVSTTSIGTSPTFNQHIQRVEVFIHNFDGDLYGKELNIDLISEIRNIEQFSSKDELINQMKKDIKQSEIFSTKYLNLKTV
ncbi:MAG: riboflavin biosynthesis protein RibF [Planctomycetaceae bacterium]|jgi:riboflavin kinase/FMN adenylyltransferase|nr:riboflavin biosynthesis protein RibF [Planctomycetaceae bacterium]